ncbi:MAG: hypothetical protein QM785_03365 [Pyrinomonadaceae bacterium]
MQRKIGFYLFLFGLVGLFAASNDAQTVALLTPDKAETSRDFAGSLGVRLGEKFKVLDESLAESAYLSVSPDTPFNLTTEQSKRIGVAIGCDAYLLIRSATTRRSAFQRAEYYESYAVIYGVSSRTGRLIYWKLQKFEAPKPEAAAKLLDASIADLADEIGPKLKAALKQELSEPPLPDYDEVPDEAAAGKDFKAPIPFRRMKPEYTVQAALFDVKATVDAFVYLDEKGSVTAIEPVRWAGFGLDGSVERNIRAMNWRPATRGTKPMAMKFLVRYNFKKIDDTNR